MNKLNINKLRNKGKDKLNISLGNRLADDKKNFYKLKREKDKTFNEMIGNLNRTLKKTESLLHINHYPKKNDVDSLFPKKELDYLKKMEYHKKWHIKYILPIMDKKNIIKKLKEQKTHRSRNIVNDFDGLFWSNPTEKTRYNKSVEDNQNIPYYLKRLEQNKSNISAKEIVKKSIVELSKKDRFSRYRYKMGEKVGTFVDYNKKYSNYYDFDKTIKKNIKDEKTGITMPGNAIHRDCIGCITTLQPKNIKIKVKTNIFVPEKTLLPVPHGIEGKGLKYTHITIKNVYNSKNILI